MGESGGNVARKRGSGKCIAVGSYGVVTENGTSMAVQIGTDMTQ